MKVVIIEDEPPARDKLAALIKRYDPKIQIIATLERIAESAVWFKENPVPDLAFADIELLDGNIFEILKTAEINCPIIFTTAYDQFLLQAFEQNGIAYLLKPFDFQKFAAAMKKFDLLKSNFAAIQINFWQEIQDVLKQPKYKERFVIKQKGGMQLIETRNIAFIQIQDEILFAFDANGNKFPINETLSNLEKLLNPQQFFRLNRSEIVNLNFIENLKPDFRDRLVVFLRTPKIKLVSSVNRAPDLRKWLDSQ
jgi:two-component system response regulator LytT